MSWDVDPEVVSAVLTGAQGRYEELVVQLYGASPGSGGPSGWDVECGVVGAVDVVVGNAFVEFMGEQLAAAGGGLDQFGSVLEATHDAAQAILWGDADIAGVLKAAEAAARGDWVVG